MAKKAERKIANFSPNCFHPSTVFSLLVQKYRKGSHTQYGRLVLVSVSVSQFASQICFKFLCDGQGAVRQAILYVERHEVIKLFSCSTELSMKIFLLINVKMPTIVGILTFMSRKNSILGLSEPKKKAELFDIFILMSI